MGGQDADGRYHQGKCTILRVALRRRRGFRPSGKLERDNWFLGLRRPKFIELLAYYYGEINARHPFREGNGRTQRAFLRQLSAAAGWRLDWSALSKEDNITASSNNFHTAGTEHLIRVLEPVVARI
jgi:cell filamentation protein